ncbi:FAD-dependent monooxygenase [Nocardioides plantarum]|uniref:FAD-dependent monooxygenase n=1 Tax=Nocardioides plantarum TaxID=29299 RepID=A0ABV5K4J0_9ACTN|nr:FAD-dependent monooxygenase [Nocardioides plantarum]
MTASGAGTGPTTEALDDVLVLGAGIAGLVLAGAWALRGGRATVLDAAASAPAAGGGLQLAPPSVAVLRGLGVDLAGAVTIHTQQTRDRDGRLLGSTPLHGCAGRYAAPYLTVRRADLHAALLERVGDLTDVRPGTAVTAVDDPDDPVVTLADGRRLVAPVVVGADGIRSVARAALARDAPVYSGLWAHRALVPVADLPVAVREHLREPVVRLWVGPGAHVVTYPVAGGRELNLVVVTGGDDDAADAPAWTAKTDPDALRHRLAGWAPDVRAVLDAVGVLRGHAVHDRPPLARLARGRLALVGDAAHPMAPFLAQGANQAVEGAVELAAALRAEDRAAGLAAYGRRRAVRAGGMQRGSREAVDLLHLSDGPARDERDRAWADETGLAHRDGLYGYPVATLLGNARASSA